MWEACGETQALRPTLEPLSWAKEWAGDTIRYLPFTYNKVLQYLHKIWIFSFLNPHICIYDSRFEHRFHTGKLLAIVVSVHTGNLQLLPSLYRNKQQNNLLSEN